MKAFVDVYSQIAQFERAAQLKEIEAQKVIDETKQKAVINGGTSVTDNNSKPKAKDIPNMTQQQFDENCAKYGTDWIYE